MKLLEVLSLETRNNSLVFGTDLNWVGPDSVRRC